MKHLVYNTTEDRYPLAILVKESAFTAQEIDCYYTQPLEARGISRNQIIVVALEYGLNNKVSDKQIKAYLETLMPALLSVGVQKILCADAKYFKVLTSQRKADAHLGYSMRCTWDSCKHLDVILGINHKALIHNPANEPKLALSLDTFSQVVLGKYKALGSTVIHSAYYPKTVPEISQTLLQLHQYPRLTLDLETFSLKFDKAGIGTVTFCWSEHEGIAFACDYREFPENCFGNLQGEYKPNWSIRALLKEFLETYQGELILHNAGYDFKVLIATLWMEDLLDTNGLLKGLEILTRKFHDTKIILYLATNSTAGNELSLKEAAHTFAGNWAVEVKDIRTQPLGKLLEYNLIDGLSTWYVFNKYYPVMLKDQQEELYQSLMLPSIKTLLQMELTGMPLSLSRVQEVKAELETIVGKHEKVLAEHPSIHTLETILQQEEMVKVNAKLKVKQHPLEHFSHVRFNPNSGPQKQKLLYDLLGLPVIDRTATQQPATAADTLEKLVNHTDNPEYQLILESLLRHGEAQKILNTFIPAFENAIHKGDTNTVWLHGNFNLGGTVSGRLSSSEPNLQNLPAGSTFGKLIKTCFAAPKGWLFCGADFSSLEDRINALITKDPNKLRVYIDGYDGHCLRTYSYWPEQFPGIDPSNPEQINSIAKTHEKQRNKSKGPTFALSYQGTWSTLVRNAGFSKEEALRIEANYHALYATSTQWVKERIQEASRLGYATAAFGLRIRTPLLAKTFLGKSSTPREAEAEARTLGNAISGQSYGLLTNRAMNATMERVWTSKHRFDILPVSIIHDANYFLVRDNIDAVQFLNEVLIEEMQWQELPEIQHEIVKLGAELDLFWPTWANKITLPNQATKEEIQALCQTAKQAQSKEGIT